MKPILVFTAIAAVAAIAVFQQSRLSSLKAETARLIEGKPAPPSKHSERPADTDEIKQDASKEQFELVREMMIEALVRGPNRPGRLDPGQVKQLLLAAAAFSAGDISRFLDVLRGDPRLAGTDPNQLVDACREIFSETAPFAWRDYLEAHRDLPDWQRHFEAAFRNCLREDGKRTLRQFDEGTAHGNRDVATSGIRTGVLIELAAENPDKMLTLAVSPEFASDPDALAHLGAATASTMKDIPDHQRFLSALRRAREKNPDSLLLETVRKDYVGEMNQRLRQWPFESIQTFVDGEFTREEKFAFAKSASHIGDLEDVAKWANWFLGIDPAEWTAWAAAHKERNIHPVTGLLENWGRADAAAAAAWLERIPPGDLRSEAVLNFAWAISDHDPERAAGYLDELPDSKGRRNLVKKLENARKSPPEK